MSHFLSVWFYPRQTIVDIIKESPPKGILFWGILGSVAELSLYGFFTGFRLGVPLKLLAGGVITAGVIYGTLGLYLGAWLYAWLGRAWGGEAKNEQVLAALAWSKVPWPAALILSMSWLLKDKATQLLPYNRSTVITVLEYAGTYIPPALILWALCLLVIMLSEVQGFSAGKALVILIAPYAVIVLLVFILALTTIGAGGVRDKLEEGIRSGVGIEKTRKQTLFQSPALDPETRALWLKTGEIIHYETIENRGAEFYVVEADGFLRQIRKKDIIKIYGPILNRETPSPVQEESPAKDQVPEHVPVLQQDIEQTAEPEIRQ